MPNCNARALSIYTTLAPSTQTLAETALTKTLDGLGKKQPELQGAMIVTGARDGEVQALIGARDPADPGFDRALDARRPIGSLVKPFVISGCAGAAAEIFAGEPARRFARSTWCSRMAAHWTPQNDDHETHGRVLLIDALVHSYNLATVHLGLDLGVDKVRGLLSSFDLDVDINPNPSLLLGAVDLSPYQVAQLYQYFAADGHALPLRALRGVVDAQGRPLTRYGVKPGAGDYVQPARLVTYAMQQVTQVGTAHAIADQGLGFLHAAGKTGTSDSQRDSWFAGFTGSHLAVVWVGRDDNKVTTCMAATGALQVWTGLFRKLPSAPLVIAQDGLDQVYINPQSGAANRCTMRRRTQLAVYGRIRSSGYRSLRVAGDQVDFQRQLTAFSFSRREGHEQKDNGINNEIRNNQNLSGGLRLSPARCVHATGGAGCAEARSRSDHRGQYDPRGGRQARIQRRGQAAARSRRRRSAQAGARPRGAGAARAGARCSAQGRDDRRQRARHHPVRSRAA